MSGILKCWRAAFFVMQNFVFSVPNTAKSLAALKNLDLIVSVDTHLSETAQTADYVIPGTTYLERYELLPQWVTFPAVGLRQPVVPPIFGRKRNGSHPRRCRIRCSRRTNQVVRGSTRNRKPSNSPRNTRVYGSVQTFRLPD